MKRHSFCDGIILFGLCLLLVFSPLAFGGVHVWAYTAIELLVFFLLGLWALDRFFFSRHSQIAWVKTPINAYALLFLAIVCIQLIPFPPFLLHGISPHTYSDKFRLQEFLKLSSEGAAVSNRWMTPAYYLHPVVVEALKLAAVFGIFFLVINSVKSKLRLNILVYVLVLTGLFEAIYAISQYFSHTPGVWWWKGRSGRGQFASGTFLGANHFAFYMEMAFSLCIGLVVAFKSPIRRIQSGSKRLRARFQTLIGMFSPESTQPRRVIIVFIAMIIGAALLLSGSRGGLFSLSLAMLFSAVLFYSKKHFQKYALGILCLFVMVLGYGTYIGIDSTLEKFKNPQSLYSRMQVNGSMLKMLADYPALGVGLGNLQYVYPRYVPGDQDEVASTGHAHNDWLEAVVDAGIFGGIVIFAGAGIFLRKLIQIWRQRNDFYAVGIGAGALIALASTGLHGFFDFSFHYPANPMTLAAIAAIGYVALYRRGAGYSESFFYPTQELVLNPGRRIVFGILLIAVAAGLAWLSSRHFLAETNCPSEWNSTMHLNWTPDSPMINRAIALNPLNADYYYKRALAELNYQTDFSAIEKDKNESAIENFKQAAARNPTQSVYWLELGKRYLAQQYDPYEYVKHWLPLADKCFDSAAAYAPKDAGMLVQAASYWVWRSAMLPKEDSGLKSPEIHGLNQNDGIKKFQKYFELAIDIDAERWTKAVELVWRYYPDGAVIFDMVPKDSSELKSLVLQWIAKKESAQTD